MQEEVLFLLRRYNQKAGQKGLFWAISQHSTYSCSLTHFIFLSLTTCYDQEICDSKKFTFNLLAVANDESLKLNGSKTAKSFIFSLIGMRFENQSYPPIIGH